MSKPFKYAFDQKPQFDAPQFEDTLNVPFDLPFPAVGVRHVDFALKKWFLNDMPIFIRDFNNQPKQVAVVWASEERWAMMQLNPDIRDEHGTLKLPLISIRRSALEPLYERTVPTDSEGTGDIILYVQEYINPSTDQKEYITSATKATTFPIVEIIKIHPPKIIRITYDVFFWANFMDDMRVMLEHMILYFGNQHAVYFDENLFFSAFLQGVTNDSNDMAIQQDERIFKTNFSISIEAPLIDKNSIRRVRTKQGVDISMELSDMNFSDRRKLKKMLDEGGLWHSPYRNNFR